MEKREGMKETECKSNWVNNTVKKERKISAGCMKERHNKWWKLKAVSSLLFYDVYRNISCGCADFDTPPSVCCHKTIVFVELTFLDLFLKPQSDKGNVTICSIQCHLTFLCLFTQVVLSLVHRVVDSAIYDGDSTSCISYVTIVDTGRGHKYDVRKEVRNKAYHVTSVAHLKLFYMCLLEMSTGDIHKHLLENLDCQPYWYIVKSSSHKTDDVQVCAA